MSPLLFPTYQVNQPTSLPVCHLFSPFPLHTHTHTHTHIYTAMYSRKLLTQTWLERSQITEMFKWNSNRIFNSKTSLSWGFRYSVTFESLYSHINTSACHCTVTLIHQQHTVQSHWYISSTWHNSCDVFASCKTAAGSQSLVTCWCINMTVQCAADVLMWLYSGMLMY